MVQGIHINSITASFHLYEEPAEWVIDPGWLSPIYMASFVVGEVTEVRIFEDGDAVISNALSFEQLNDISEMILSNVHSFNPNKPMKDKLEMDLTELNVTCDISQGAGNYLISQKQKPAPVSDLIYAIQYSPIYDDYNIISTCFYTPIVFLAIDENGKCTISTHNWNSGLTKLTDFIVHIEELTLNNNMHDLDI